MKTRNSVLTLAVAIAIAGGAYALTAPSAQAAELASNGAVVTPGGDAAADAKEAADKAAHEASEAAADAKDAAAEARNEATEDSETPASGISALVIYDKLTAAGYTDIGDIRLDDNVWNVEAKDKSGKEVELKVDPNDGHIISSKND